MFNRKKREVVKDDGGKWKPENDNAAGNTSLSSATIPKEKEPYVNKPLALRQAESRKIREKHPNRVPIIVESAQKRNSTTVEQSKYLVPADLTWQQFLFFIRKRMKLDPEKAIYVFVNKLIPAGHLTVGEIDAANRDEAGFLSCVYAAENTFGE